MPPLRSRWVSRISSSGLGAGSSASTAHPFLGLPLRRPAASAHLAPKAIDPVAPMPRSKTAMGSAARPIGSDTSDTSSHSSNPTAPKKDPTNSRSGVNAQDPYRTAALSFVSSPVRTRLHRCRHAHAWRAPEASGSRRSKPSRSACQAARCHPPSCPPAHSPHSEGIRSWLRSGRALPGASPRSMAR